MQAMRREFRRYANGGSTIDAETLARIWLSLADDDRHSRGGPILGARDLQAVALRVAQLLQEMYMRAQGEVNEDEFVHVMLLMQADRIASTLSMPLKAALGKYPGLLQNLQMLFESADTSGNDALTCEQLVDMYRRRAWRLHPTAVDGKPLSDEELQDPVGLGRRLLEAMDVNGDGVVSYAEFVGFCVGRRKSEVVLHMYDLSGGSAGKVPWLLGSGLERLWHTGVVAFDREYFFSSDTIFDHPGKTSFGEPTKVVSLGCTLWNQEELHDFIVNDLKPIFHRETYDIINNNCNHFSDRLSMYLTGRHLPEEVLSQPERLMNLVSVRTIRPFLNWLLRDCVVQRQGTARTVEVPHGQWHRLLEEDEVSPGAVVAIHPLWGRGAGVLGVVCEDVVDLEVGRRGVLASTEIEFGTAGCGVVSCTPWLPQSGVTQRSVNSSERKVCVKYLEVLTPSEIGSSACKCQLYTEKVPISRISLAALDGITIGSTYRTTLSALTQQLAAILRSGHSRSGLAEVSGDFTSNGGGNGSLLKTHMSHTKEYQRNSDSDIFAPAAVIAAIESNGTSFQF